MRLWPPLPALALVACALSAAPARADRGVLHDTNLVIDRVLVPEAEATAYVEVRGATALRASRPVAGAAVRLSARPIGGKGDPQPLTPLAAGRTDRAGRALLRFRVPRLAPGRYELRVTTRSPHGSGELVSPVDIAESAHLHLRTDRPVYRPGQPLRWRATLLSAANAHPLRNSEVEVVVEDPNGTAIWRGRETTDETGMVSGELPLGDDLILGQYRVRASARGARASETVAVKAFVLPPFELSIDTDGRAAEVGGTIGGRVIARYHYGEPVRGAVEISAGAGEVVRGELDAAGRFRFELPVSGDGAMQLRAQVTDGAGRSRSVARAVPLPSSDLKMALIPERRELAAGQTQWLTIVTTDGRGELEPATVSLQIPGKRRLVRRSPGALRVRVPAPDAATGSWRLSATASTADARVAEAAATVAVRERPQSLRPVHAVVGAGEPVELRGRWPANSGPVVLSLVRDGAPLASTVTVPRGGVLRAHIQPPPGLFGLFTVRATDLHWDRSGGAVTPRSADATVYLRPRELEVAIRGQLRHRPGDTARLTVEVRDGGGAPVGGAALAASVVDERILALGDERPDLVAALRSLEVGEAHTAGLAFASLLPRSDTPVRRAAMRAILESLPPEPAAPLVSVAAADRLRAEVVRLSKARAELLAHLVDRGAVAERAGRELRYRQALHQHLAALKWEPAARLTPWSEPTSWRYAADAVPALALAPFTLELAERRLDALAAELRELRTRARRRLLRDPDRLSALRLAPGLLVDPWGQAIVVRPTDDGGDVDLVSPGLDGRLGTRDDLVRAGVFTVEVSGYGSGYGVGFGGIGHGRYGTVGHGAGVVSGPAEARVRRRFDETVLWVAGVRTDARGRAKLAVPLADSITGWEVAVEAVGGAGGVGAAKARLETFLPVHVDAEIPHALTTGDRYAIPVAVANHRGGAGRFEIAAQVRGAAELAGPARQIVEVQDGAAAPVYVTVRATDPGEAIVRLSLRAGGASVDELERRIQVRAPGLVVRELRRGRLEGGQAAIDFRVPADHAAGSARATLTLFRGASDVALDGLEGMLAEPHGCFEQTSSTTHPNLLVLELLQGRPGAEAITARARELVAKGYQRLISYEVRGGGFSWFGDAPANQILTAYGLLEFSDMSRVYPVDPKLVERTRAWLLAKQRADGSWQPDPSWLHDWSAVQGRHSTTAYIAWALAESGYRGPALTRALGYLRRNAKTLRRSPYLASLWAAAEAAAETRDHRALAALRRAADASAEGTRYSAGGATLFYARGDSADVQVTALAAAALQRRGDTDEAQSAREWLWSARTPHGWGSTQSTVLALRAAALSAAGQAPPSGRVQVELDGIAVGELDLEAPALPSLELDELAPGAHRLRLLGPSGASLRADLRVRWQQAGAPEAAERGLEVGLNTPTVPPAVGSLAPFALQLANPGKDSVAMPTAVVPVPPGFRVDPRSLRELERRGAVERAEDRGSEIALYLAELAPGARLTLPYQLEAVAVCDVHQAPARAYAYYTPELGGTSRAHRVEVLRQRRRPAPRITALRSPPPPMR